MLQVGPSTYLHRGDQKLTLGQIEPGSEIVARVSPSSQAAATERTNTVAGSQPIVTAGVVPASEIETVWSPLASR